MLSQRVAVRLKQRYNLGIPDAVNADQIRVATQYLAITASEASSQQRVVPEIDATYFWQGTRGGNALLVGTDFTMLFATSSVRFDEHIAAYAAGRRTLPSEF
jgi:hypothetical protein